MTEKNRLSAIICEFDPLHFGHKLLLDTARAAGAPVCCVMSGNFTQRGAPAMLDKWARTRLALENGADLVVELPVSWACAGAERFAAGGVALAAALGADRLWFGSECPDPERLSLLAGTLLSPAFSQALDTDPCPGESFAHRRQRAVTRLLGPDIAALLALPNANLGVEYIKAIRRQKVPMEPCPIHRQGAGHGESLPSGRHAPAPANSLESTGPNRLFRPAPYKEAPFLSAGQLREMVRNGEPLSGLVPDSTADAIFRAKAQGRCPADITYLERAVLCRLRSMDIRDLVALPDLSEGLEHRLRSAARSARSLEELYALVKSRRYSHARVRRLVLAAFLGLRAPLPELPPYLRLLGLGRRGREALRQCSPSLPVIVRAKDVQKLSPEAQAVFQQEVRASDLYALACPVPQPAGMDFSQGLIKLVQIP